MPSGYYVDAGGGAECRCRTLWSSGRRVVAKLRLWRRLPLGLQRR